MKLEENEAGAILFKLPKRLSGIVTKEAPRRE